MEEKIRQLLTERGAALVGFADISGLPESANRGYPRAVCYAVALTPGVVARIPTGPHREYSDEYDSRNAQLDDMAHAVAAFLEEAGHSALPITRGSERAGTKWVTPYYETPLPHKTVARLAGLGWPGKCATLVTPEYGNALRFTTVLTDAPLAPGTPVEASRCGSCTACQKACPAGAVQGAEFSLAEAEGLDPKDARALLFDAAACSAMARQRGENHPGYSATCGLCIAACPYTVKYLRRAGL